MGSELESARRLFADGLGFLAAKNYKDAESSFRQALELVPERVSVLTNLSAALLKQGKMAESAEYARRAVAIDQNNEQAWLNLGAGLEEIGNPEGALDCYDKALALKPDYAEVWSNRANLLKEMARFDEALNGYDRALMVRPDFAEAWSNRGSLLRNLRRYDEALSDFNKALEIEPNLVEALTGRGNVFQALSRFDEAMLDHDKALAFAPDFAEAWLNRGYALKSLQRYDEALDSFNRAINSKPDYAEAWYGRGLLMVAQKRLDDAMRDYGKAMEIKPGLDHLLGDWLHIKMFLCDWEGLDAAFEKITQGIKENNKVCPPFNFLSMPGKAALQKRCAELAIPESSSAAISPVDTVIRPSIGKIRIGYFSSDFRNHPVSFLAAGMFESHDRSRFEVIGFNLHAPTHDEMESRLAEAFDEWVNLSSMDFGQALELVRQKRIDIAIDLNGYTSGSGVRFFSQRIAPVQVNYLGYPGTMGASFMDYIVGDNVLIPEERRKDYSEKVVYMPNSFMVNDSTKEIAHRIPDRAEMGLPENAFVFCCFNQSYKITPDVFTIWMNLLKKVPGSVLWLSVGDKITIQNLKAECAKREVDPARLIFAKRVDLMSEHLARHRLADLFLDTLYYNAHTTASDALWAGLPVLTCQGETFAGRVAASLLNAVGLPELITRSHEEYENLAYELATNPGKLSNLKARLAENRLTYPLFDTALFTKHIEVAYTMMWDRHQAGLPPDHLFVKSGD